MPERNHEVIIDGFVFPDTVTVTLANDEYIDSRDYVDKDLYESVSSANDYWQAENSKLRELLAEDNEELAKMRRVIDYLYSFAKACGVDAEDMRELGVEVGA